MFDTVQYHVNKNRKHSRCDAIHSTNILADSPKSKTSCSAYHYQFAANGTRLLRCIAVLLSCLHRLQEGCVSIWATRHTGALGCALSIKGLRREIRSYSSWLIVVGVPVGTQVLEFEIAEDLILVMFKLHVCPIWEGLVRCWQSNIDRVEWRVPKSKTMSFVGRVDCILQFHSCCFGWKFVKHFF